jgi:uncharacterized protein (TIGR03086 family)
MCCFIVGSFRLSHIGRTTQMAATPGPSRGSFCPSLDVGRMGGVADDRRGGIRDNLAMTTWDREVQRLVEHGRDREAAALAVRHLSGPNREGGSMHPLDQLDQLGPVLGGVVSQIRSDQLDQPTPCADFTVRGVLGHMVAGATSFAAGFRGQPAPADTNNGSADPLTDFGPALTGLAEAMHSPGALDRTITAPFGDVPGDAFARFVILDGLVHGWDLATATGQAYDPPDALVAAVDTFAREAIVPAMREAGMFAAPEDAPADATPIERIAAFTGRSVVRSQR